MVVPIRRVFIKMLAQEPSTHDGTVAWFVAGGLGALKKVRGLGSIQRKEAKGALAKVH